ncbi:MAG: molecular chaperone TorD family protein [Myxococcales bacterium]|nr:molecular chaperone TorD family protein [Myxococcales bacterium]
MTTTPAESQEFAHASASMYAFVAKALLVPPDAAWLTHLSQPSVREALEAAGVDLPTPLPPIDDVIQEFHLLFRVPTDRYVRPYESVWLEADFGDAPTPTGSLFGAQTVAVAGEYQRFGYTPPSSPRELMDHVGVEADYVAWLWASASTGADEHAQSLAEPRTRFLQDHLAPFARKLYPQVKNADRTGIYAALVQLLLRLVEDDLRKTHD